MPKLPRELVCVREGEGGGLSKVPRESVGDL